MKNRRIFLILMMVVLLMVTSMTAFAKSASDSDEFVTGQLQTWGIEGTKATTWSKYTNGNKVYVNLIEEYISSVGNMYTSNPVIKTGTGHVSAMYTPAGKFLSAWNSHGRAFREFTIYL